MENLNWCLDRIIENKTANSFAVLVGQGDNILCEAYRSHVQKIDSFTRFDMASVTKIMATTSLCLIAFDMGLFNLDTKVSDFYTCPESSKDITVFNLLTHTMGIGYKWLALPTTNYNNIAEHILSIKNDIPIGSDVLYSCPAFILLGKILEQAFNDSLDVLFDRLVAKKLDMLYTSFCPNDKSNTVNANTQSELLGTVNDYNCRHLGGVAGNAGIFSSIHDMTKFAKMLLSCGAPIIDEKTFMLAVQNHTKGKSAARGLGFLYVDEQYTQTGDLFPVGSFGHCGHTGQSIFVDLKSKLYAIILSDATVTVEKKYGKENYDEVKEMRRAIHNAIALDLK